MECDKYLKHIRKLRADDEANAVKPTVSRRVQNTQ